MRVALSDPFVVLTPVVEALKQVGASGPARQWDDQVGVRMERLDRAYLAHWAAAPDPTCSRTGLLGDAGSDRGPWKM